MKDNAERAINKLKILVRECKELAAREQNELIAQMNEIETAISNLERATVPVPEELKGLKNKISVNLQKKKDQDHTLEYLKSELREMLASIEGDNSVIVRTENKKSPKVIFEDDEFSIRPSMRAAKRR
ncbi:hypothetical protein GF337_03060 [candidate division KSB1 bacterium]|nr:hypothetical protein [candidate division KSB1 bacterium]